MVPLAPSLDHAGPIARTPADAALLYQVLAGDPGPDLPPTASPPVDLRVDPAGCGSGCCAAGSPR